MTKHIIIILIFCSLNLAAEEFTFKTITEALNWDGDRDALTKLIITDSIAGNDYSDESEWSKFRTLDETFPNIEEVEIWTGQDIPKAHQMTDEYGLSLFNKFYYQWDDTGRPIVDGSNWLRKFTAPNVKYIGGWAHSIVANR